MKIQLYQNKGIQMTKRQSIYTLQYPLEKNVQAFYAFVKDN